VSLPVPVQQIIEGTIGLTIVYDEIPEPAGSTILGALSPSDRTIVLNERHEDLFSKFIGPERFTLAHELGHWVYDADMPGQQTLDLSPSEDVFCYHRQADTLSETARIRETNASKFAACLLMPRHLVRAANIDRVLANFREVAKQWGVSQQSLGYRLRELDLIDDFEAAQLNFR